MFPVSVPSAASLDAAPCSVYAWPNCRMTVELPISWIVGGRTGLEDGGGDISEEEGELRGGGGGGGETADTKGEGVGVEEGA